MDTLPASRIATLQASRLLVGFLTWLIVTACVCGEISTDAENDDNDIPSFVLVDWMEKVKSGTHPISIMTDTEYANDCEKSIVLDINGSRVEAEIYHHDSIHVTINGGMTNLSSKDINDLKMNLKGQELKHGRNKLVLQNSSYYHVRVFSQTLQYEQHLQTITITKYFHLYLFAPPKIEYDKSHGCLLCHVNHTGANEYGNWIIEFYKETLEGKNSVENCTKHIPHKSLTGSYRVYYNTDLGACVLQLSNPVQQQDAGNYSCALHIRHAETDRLTTFQYQNTIEVQTSSQPSEIPIPLIVPSVVGGVFIILFVVLIPVCILLRHWRQHPPVIGDVEQGPPLNPHDPQQDPLLEPQNGPPSRAQSRPPSRAQSRPPSRAQSRPPSRARSRPPSRVQSRPPSRAQSRPPSRAQSPAPGLLLQDQNPDYGSVLEGSFQEQESPLNAQPSQQTLQQQRPDLSSPNSQGSPPLKQHPVESPPTSPSDSPSDNISSADDETSLEQNTVKGESQRPQGAERIHGAGGTKVSGKNKRKKRVKGQEQEEERKRSRE